jgi:thioredoxin reductase (NADPH)
VTTDERTFPVLSNVQHKRIAAHGESRAVAAGEVLVERGQIPTHCFIVDDGALEIVAPRDGTLLATLRQGQFTGEANMLAGRPGLVRIRAIEGGHVTSIGRERLLSLVQSDSELSDLFMRAFLLRRGELLANAVGDVVVAGSPTATHTLRLREFLTRNGHPHVFVDTDTAEDVSQLLGQLGVAPAELPIVVCRGTRVLRNPGKAELADCLGFNASVDRSRVWDLVVVGAGPAGLAAAVYAASEGLSVLVVECDAPGGQAGSSSKIENYLGFPTGISGQDLANRAYGQAQKFGTEFLISRAAKGLVCERAPLALILSDDSRVSGRAIVVATGATYRRLPIEGREQFEGCGIYYAATFLEAQLCRDQDVVVVGGGNSAGQAAVFLAKAAKRVQVLVRGEPANSMSDYLIRRLRDLPNVFLRTRVEIVGLHGTDHLESVTWHDLRNGAKQTHGARHLFSMTGAVPSTSWLQGCLTLDSAGFVKTGIDLSADDLKRDGWPLSRPPQPMETSRPGVFAVGDVRARSLKRVAAAVGEGGTAIGYVHSVLRAAEGGSDG